MKKFTVLALGLAAAACGEASMDGVYSSAADPGTTLNIQADKVVATHNGETKSGAARKADKSMFLTLDGETLEFKIDDKGCLIHAEAGTFCKK